VNASLDTLTLKVLGCSVKIQCEDSRALALLALNYGHMRAEVETADVNYTVCRANGAAAFLIAKENRKPLMASGDSELLFLFEKDLTIDLQRLRCDLYFVHSAVLEFAGKALMLVGESGSGKSTTAWALLHHGFRYLSDELGPVDLETLRVQPYPHALCLKDEPPRLYRLPERTLYTAQTLHVPTETLPAETAAVPIPLTAIFFLRYRPEASAPSVQPISRAEAGARLLAHALNPLAHPGNGLDGAIEIVRKTAQFKLSTTDLPSTCAVVKDTLRELSGLRCERVV
jgi:hypothetical protein